MLNHSSIFLQNDKMVVDKTHFFTLPHCSIFNASMYSIVISNESVSLDWTEIIQTKINLEENFLLENFQVNIGRSDSGTNDEASAEWTHSNQCVKKYMIQLSYNDTTKHEVKGKIEISAPPHLGEKVQLDLHTIPGKLFAQNVYARHEFSLFITDAD